MLCCMGPWRDPESVSEDQTRNSGVSPFPGQRRKALVTPDGNNCSNDAHMMVNVVIPPGMQAGQTLQVAAPDGSRTVNATIPQGMSPGQSFFVSFPVASAAGHDNTSDNNSNGNGNGNGNGSGNGAAGPLPTPVAAPLMPPVVSPMNSPAGQPSTAPFSQALDRPPPTSSRPANPPVTSSSSNHNGQKLLLVNVPPGQAPGSTLYVNVPGENRMLAAKVPSGVSQFHVAYQPRASAGGPTPTSTPAAPMGNNTNQSHNNNNNNNNLPTNNNNNNGQKLILVRVPPGIAPGSTLHVEVPDEPGRILAAQVPTNVREFQVAYLPRLNKQQQPHAASGYDTRPSHNNNNNLGYDGGNGMGNAMIPLIGGAALGAAGVAMYDHYHHANQGYHQDYNAGYDMGAYDDTVAYDYNGAQYGGDFSGVFDGFK